MTKHPVPDNFNDIIVDLISDLDTTFPEYRTLLTFYKQDSFKEKHLQSVFDYCVTFFPERFFDILYQNDEIFTNNTNTHFLPHLDFRIFFTCEDVSDKTKQTLWKYLQLLLFNVIENVEDKSMFGEASSLFEGIDEGELQSKLSETMEGMTDFFKNMESAFEQQNEPKEEGEERTEEGEENRERHSFADAMPNLSSIQEHLTNLFNGKIGKLAKEMAEELSSDFTEMFDEQDQSNANPQHIMKKLMKNPKKIMDLMKKVQSKLDSKMKSGEISREEMMKEAQTLLGQMKDMGGEQGLNDMLKNMAQSMGGMGKNMKVDMNAINRLTKNLSQKQGIHKRHEAKKQQMEASKLKEQEDIKERIRIQKELMSKYSSLEKTDNQNEYVFKMDDGNTQEKSFIHPDLLKELEEEPESAPKKKKNKKKKKKTTA